MIYFISGHRDLTREEFEEYYIPLIDEAMDNRDLDGFVVGDYHGVDKMAMDYLWNATGDLTIYHMFDTPRNTPMGASVELCEKNGIQFMGGYLTDEERDSAMTKASDVDIAFVKDNRWDSGTAQNIKRRHSL